MGNERILTALAQQVRRDILISTTAAGSGHATSSLSAVELMVGLMFGGFFRADVRRPDAPNNDRLIFSKGHASPLLYALYASAGAVGERDLKTLRKFGSRLEGHPSMRFPFTEAPTGSLGQGLSVGLGEAMAARFQRLSFRTYVLLGDSEMAEGSIWEALQLAAFRKADNLAAILDVNRLGQSGPTMIGHQLTDYAKRVESFGWRTIIIDGHNFAQIQDAYKTASMTIGRPTMILAKTFKGRGVSFLENRQGWHGKAISEKQLEQALQEIPQSKRLRGVFAQPRRGVPRSGKKRQALKNISAAARSPREAFGDALMRLGSAWPQMVVLDGEVKNSTFTEKFAVTFPERFIQAYIAEQNMVGVSTGLAARGQLPVAATFGAFFTRAFDQLRMAHYAGFHQVFAGTHIGVHIGEDGFSQMGLEDIAMFRALPGTTILYPADGVSAERLLELGLKHDGVMYLRLTRGILPTLYKSGTRFQVGGSHTLRSSRNDTVTIVAAGVTLHEALKASEELAKKKVHARVVDVYSIQPIDSVTLRKAARETRRILTVEDHVLSGGIGEATRSALGALAGTVRSLGVTKTPRSGRPEQLLAYEGIDAAGIVKAVLSWK
jgi:transketolase